MDESGGKNGNQVSTQHDFIGSKSVDGDFITLDTSGNKPTNDGKNESSPGGNDGTSSRGFFPGHHVPQGNDGRSNDDSHEQVHPSKIQSNFEENDGEASHEETENDNDNTRDKEDLGSSSFGVDVFTVDIVGDKGGDGNRFGRSSGHNGHEKHDKNQSGTSISEQFSGHGRGDQTGSGFIAGDGKHEGGGGKTEGSGKRERNGEPADSSKQVSLGGRTGLGGDGGLPVGLIDKDGSKVSDDVDDTEHETVRRKHGQVRTVSVSRDRTTCVLSGFKEGFVLAGVEEESFAEFGAVADGIFQKVIDVVGGVDLDVDEEDHGNQHSKDNDSVDVRGQESSLETTGGSVQNDTPGDKERSKTVVDTSQGFDGGGTTEQKHGGHDNVGAEAEEQEGEVGSCSPTSVDNFGDGVGGGSHLLEVDGQDTEQEDLNGGTRGIPVME